MVRHENVRDLRPAPSPAGRAAGGSGRPVPPVRGGAVPGGPDAPAGRAAGVRAVREPAASRPAEKGKGGEGTMTLLELSVEYRAHARALDFRICQLQAVLERTENEDQRLMLNERIHMLSTMLREARELAVLTERYYERGYRRNAKYTL